MDSEYLSRLVFEYNPHLRSGGGEKVVVPEFKRTLYREVEKWFGRKQAIAITGLRRTGKTTLMRQVMQGLGSEAAFFSFDEEETQKKEVLVFVINFFLNNFKSKYLFLDEIQYVDDWEGVLKRYYDLKNVKFVVSGSESLELRKAKAALAGRLVSFELEPLSFKEYLALKGRRIVGEAAFSDFEALEVLYRGLMTEKEFFEREFAEYLFKGAFPELANEDDEAVIIKCVKDSVVKKIVYRDIPAVFKIKRKDLLFELFKYACENSANLFEIKNLCNIFKADYETVSNYLFYLRSAFLIKTAESYSRSSSKRARKNKKIYAAHPSLALATLGYGRGALVEKILGQYVESVFAQEFFWRDKQKNEVDAVFKDEKGKTVLPVEVKYRNRLDSSDLKGLLKFLNDFELEKGVIVTKNVFEKKSVDGKKLLFVPAWLFALAC